MSNEFEFDKNEEIVGTDTVAQGDAPEAKEEAVAVQLCEEPECAASGAEDSTDDSTDDTEGCTADTTATAEVTTEQEPKAEAEAASEADAEAEAEEEIPAETKVEVDTTPVLKCTDLTKSYKRRVKVLDKLNLTVPKGKIVGLLGPNGCGKSTLMKLVTGILSADSGEIEICGIPRGEMTNSLVSYLPERTYFNSWMKVDSLIDYFADFYTDFDVEIARKMFADLGINTKSKLRTLSKGTKEKVQLIMVMARRAKLYLLDEPIAGVDPAARDYIMRTIIGNYNPEATVIITTHLIYDIEPALDEFYFMTNGGKIVLSGVCDDVRAAYGKSLDQLFKEVFRC